MIAGNASGLRRALNILRPDGGTRATHHIRKYRAHPHLNRERARLCGGPTAILMFDVPTDPTYGQLSRQDLEQLQAGARVDVVDVKRIDGLRAVEKGNVEKRGEPAALARCAVGRGRPGLAH